MLRIDNNSLLLIIFFIFFVLLPSDNTTKKQPETPYEEVQLRKLFELYTEEVTRLNNTDFGQPLQNITGFMYTLDDLVVNKADFEYSLGLTNGSSDVWYGYPLPNKEYNYKYNLTKAENNYIPQRIIDTVFGFGDGSYKGIWNKEISQDSGHVFVQNITSTTLRGFLTDYEDFSGDFIHMPLPNYYKIQENETSPLPELGSFFVNDTLTRSANYSTNLELSGGQKLKIDILDHISYPRNENVTEFLSFYTATVSLASSHLLPTVSDLLLCYEPGSGRLFGVTNSAKFHGLFAIPTLMALDESQFESYRDNVVSLLQTQYLNENITIDSILIMNERARQPEFLLYGQVEPSQKHEKHLHESDFKSLYSEERTLKIESLLLYSPDTARSYFNLNPSFKGVLGAFVPINIKYDSMVYVTLPFVIFMGVFFWQISMMNSPSELNKLSNWTIKTFSFFDSLTGIVFLIMGITLSYHTNGQFAWFLFNAGLFMIMGLFFELRISVLILQSQFLERSFSIQTLFQRFHSIASDENAAEPTVDVNTAGNEDTALILPRLQGQLFFQLFMSAFVIVILYSSAAIIRHTIVNLILLAQSFLFWPQVFRFGLIDYTVGTSSLSCLYIITVCLTRIIPVFYFFYYEDNLFQHSPNHVVLFLYVFNMSLAALILMIQLRHGGRCLLPDVLVSALEHAMNINAKDGNNKYDYSKAVSEDELTHMGKKNAFVCPICMDEDNIIHLKVHKNNSEEELVSEDGPAEDEKQYMVTPCNHVYHPECLTYWMNNKLVCPVCRSNLPPL